MRSVNVSLSGSGNIAGMQCFYFSGGHYAYTGYCIMPDSLLIEGGILGIFVVLDGIWVVGFPPYGDEPQGYAIIAIGVFILLFTYEFVRRNEPVGG
jgi:hypothetical protein